MRILLIDHYDSFTRNLEHLLFRATGAEVDVRPHDIGPKHVAPTSGRLEDIRCHVSEQAGVAPAQLVQQGQGSKKRSVDWTEVARGYDLTVLSPGPGHPSEYLHYGRLLRSGLPVFGVCLGLQIMNVHFGGTVSRLQDCVHGRADEINWFGRRVFVARYHSLYISSVAEPFEVVASLDSGVPMFARHTSLPVCGCQFHPESFLTSEGEQFVQYALEHCFS